MLHTKWLAIVVLFFGVCPAWAQNIPILYASTSDKLPKQASLKSVKNTDAAYKDEKGIVIVCDAGAKYVDPKNVTSILFKQVEAGKDGTIDQVVLKDKTVLKGQVKSVFRLVNGLVEWDADFKTLQFIIMTSPPPATASTCQASVETTSAHPSMQWFLQAQAPLSPASDKRLEQRVSHWAAY